MVVEVDRVVWQAVRRRAIGRRERIGRRKAKGWRLEAES
jgi:hypothetical protein